MLSARHRIPGFEGPVIDRSHLDYDRARRVWNGAVDRRPALIAECIHAADVRAALAYARSAGLSISVRGGGHSLPGHGTCDDGVVIDLRRMNRVAVDRDSRIATVGPGTKWGELDRATGPYGLATPGGDTSTVGVAGLTLGGGLGWLSRMYGMTSDNLLAALVVTAEGEELQVDDTTHSDLFWALRGGGGNFGVVTELRFRLHEVPRKLLSGALIYPITNAVEVLCALEALSSNLPDEVSWTAAFLTAREPAPAELISQPILAIRLCYVGPPSDEAWAALAPLRAVGRPIADTVGEMEYTQLQQFTDANAPWGAGYASASEWLRHLGSGSAEALVRAALNASSPLSLSLINLMGGAVGRLAPDATAFAYRHAPYVATIVAGWESAADNAQPHRAWARDLWESLLPASAGGGYVNLLGDEGPERVRSAYGERHYSKLAAVKLKYDPHNVFHHNQNIRPAIHSGFKAPPTP
jgi:FAD/FMN-containing dehydrogenase